MNRTRLTAVGRWLIPFLVACGIVAGCTLERAQPPTPAVVVTADPRVATHTGEPTAVRWASATPEPTPTATPPPPIVPGAPGNGGAACMRISADGRYVAFSSNSTNLVAGDTNEAFDVFVHDRLTGQTERVSVATGGGQAHGDSLWPAISGDGRWVAFDSTAEDLVPGDTNEAGDVFIHDRETGRTELVSVGLGGVPADGHSMRPSISADGRYVTFDSEASNLVPGGAPAGKIACYLYDREERTIRPAQVVEFAPEVSADGRWELYTVAEPYPTATPGPPPKMAPGVPPRWTTINLRERESGETIQVARFLARWVGGVVCGTLGPTLSADGRWVAYLAPGGHELWFYGVFLYDRESGTSRPVTVGADGGPPDGDAEGLSISADGRIVAFTSLAQNLVPEMATRGVALYTWDRETGVIERVDVASR